MELLWTVFLLVCAAVGVYFAIAAIFFLVVMAIVLGMFWLVGKCERWEDRK